MKKLATVFFTVLLALVFSSSVFAQETITTEANVLKELSFDVGGTTVNFGDVTLSAITANSSTDYPTLDPRDGQTNSNIASGGSEGRAVITGGSGEEVSISITGGTLNHSSGDELTYAPDVIGKQNDTSDKTSTTDITESGDNITLDASTGKYTLWFGGTIHGTTDNNSDGYSTGSYSGTAQITINYTTN